MTHGPDALTTSQGSQGCTSGLPDGGSLIRYSFQENLEARDLWRRASSNACFRPLLRSTKETLMTPTKKTLVTERILTKSDHYSLIGKWSYENTSHLL
jgi:hypothetical protein